jgi:hypothetical protein
VLRTAPHDEVRGLRLHPVRSDRFHGINSLVDAAQESCPLQVPSMDGRHDRRVGSALGRGSEPAEECARQKVIIHADLVDVRVELARKCHSFATYNKDSLSPGAKGSIMRAGFARLICKGKKGPLADAVVPVA